MKNSFKSGVLTLFFTILIIFGSAKPAAAIGWEDNGSIAVVEDGCLYQVGTESWKLFGISWATREFKREIGGDC